jgi:hypothetical protein
MKTKMISSLYIGFFGLSLVFFLSMIFVNKDSPLTVLAQKNKTEARQEADNYIGPIVDYDADYKPQRLNDAKEQQIRQIRASRYNARAPQPLADYASVEFAVNTDWEVGLPPLPVAKSDAVVLGHVVDAQAHLAKDRTGVFSEFRVEIDRVFKNPALQPKDSITTEREGGVVQFSSGRLLPYRVFGQRLPRSNRQYVLFLKKNQQGEDYHIITGYEIHREQVKPLDEPSKFAVFQGMSKDQFLGLVQEAADEYRQKERTNK